MVREYSERLLDLQRDSTVALEGLAAWACAAGDQGSPPSSALCWFPPRPATSKAGSTWRWRIRRPAAGSRPPNPYDEAIKVRPQSAESLHQSGNSAGATERSRGRSLRIRARDSGGWRRAGAVWNLALLLERGGQIEDAERWYQHVLEKAPRKKKRASVSDTCGSSAAITPPPSKPSRAA